MDRRAALMDRSLRLLAVAPVFIALVLVLLLGLNYRSSVDEVKQRFVERQLLLSRQTAVSVAESTAALVHELDRLAASPAIRRMDVAAFGRAARQAFRFVRRYHVNDIGLLDARGVVRATLDAPQLVGRDFSFRRYFRAARASGSSTPRYQFITFKGVDAGKKGVIIARPLRDGGRFAGAVIFTLVASELIEGFVPRGSSVKRAWVIDGDGVVLYHPEFPAGTALRGRSVASPSLRAFADQARRGAPHSGEYVTLSGQHFVGSAHPVQLPGARWVVVIAAEEDAARAPITRVSWEHGIQVLVALSLVIICSTIVYLMGRRWRLRLEAEVAQRTSQLRSLTSELSLACERERRRIADGLHDRVGQSLAVVSNRLSALRADVPTEEGSEKLSTTSSLLGQVIQDLRTLTFELSPPILYELGLLAAVEWLAEQMEREHGLRVAFSGPEIAGGGFPTLREDAKVTLFHSLRELLFNVAKHARAREAKVELRSDAREVFVIVEDDGMGFNISTDSTAGGFGLFSIRERMGYLGGRLELSSSPGRGTRAVLRSPLDLGQEELNHAE